VHYNVYIYISGFTVHGHNFQEGLTNLKIVLQRCKDMSLYLSNEKCLMFMNEGIILGHHISSFGIEVEIVKLFFIYELLAPQKPKHVIRFFGHAMCYRRFIKYFSQIATPLFTFLVKIDEFL
jgi:hypothetical protein